MKQLYYIITSMSLITAVTGLSPVLAAGAEQPPTAEHSIISHRNSTEADGYKLSNEQMDKVHAGITAAQWATYKRGIASCSTTQCYVGWTEALYVAQHCEGNILCMPGR